MGVKLKGKMWSRLNATFGKNKKWHYQGLKHCIYVRGSVYTMYTKTLGCTQKTCTQMNVFQDSFDFQKP